ncbi:MAG: acyl-ACP--UDP-N-acetylglucosamine O-acyltransferase [Flavobacteriales bacterium]|nr:acyl-ACP--UDP-N-acetylglucosamine O-acyltransferase [Flavobacteriales bacterium]MBL6873166.1 acyl-ACP--UDP-N-acetylglucosamine O-acyltransferase [Flavobacteriales bacterium]
MSTNLKDIHPNATIGDNVTIDSFTTIHEDVEIGEGTWIGSNVTIMNGARIGKNCKIFQGSVISAIPQDLKFGGEDSVVTIGDNTTIRECVTINRATNYSGVTSVGNNCLIMAYVHIAHDCHIDDYAILVNSVQLGGHVEIGKHAIIGGISAVHQFVKIGEYCMVSGGSLVRKDVPPYIKAAKEPLTFIGINSIGLKRKEFAEEKINEIQNIYRVIFQENFNYTQAIEKVESEFTPSIERDSIISFIKESERGIVKGQKK